MKRQIVKKLSKKFNRLPKPPKDKRGNYLLPVCWLGGVKTKMVIQEDGTIAQIITEYKEEEVNLQCKCKSAREAFECMEGHLTECHMGLNCAEARCNHHRRNMGMGGVV